ncbi:hypothetical protein BT93_I0638 [Corymbia citriodora subsp. variegata]|nr:hypothetical protein BT93_I0638 [Corymbia citriodora subsp. variegata]
MREVCSDGLAELGRISAFGSVLDSDSRGVEAKEPCEASDSEKQKAASAIGQIMSVLTDYSKSTGRLVCGERCLCTGSSPLNSSVFISLGRIKQSFVLTDVNLPNIPIVYASYAFLKLTGYSRHEVLGRNCRFLNGMDTDSSTLFQIFAVRRGNFLFVLSIGSFGGNGNIEGVVKSCRIELLYGK